MFFIGSKKHLKTIIDTLITAGRLDSSVKIPLRHSSALNPLSDAANETLKSLRLEAQSLQTTNNQLQTILDSMDDAVIAVDIDKKVIFLNPAMEKIFSLKDSVSRGKSFLEIIRNNDFISLVEKVFKDSLPATVSIQPANNSGKYLKLNAYPMFKSAKLSGCLLIIQDISQMRRLETMRQDFVANLSHELKTPLTSIKGFVETLIESGLDDKENALHFLKIIQNHSNRLGGLIDDLLQLSYLESRQISLEVEKIDLQTLVYETILGFGSQTRKKNVEILNQIPEHTFISADKEKIQRVFVNLIDNALKFNKDNGKIIIACQDLNSTHLKITVEDTGCGMPEKDLTRVFERFYRVDKARSRELGGTGLGLSIVKHIIELHQGMVGVESKEGLGSKFWFTLPR